jgi:hypothetical protein
MVAASRVAAGAWRLRFMPATVEPATVAGRSTKTQRPAASGYAGVLMSHRRA